MYYGHLGYLSSSSESQSENIDQLLLTMWAFFISTNRLYLRNVGVLRDVFASFHLIFNATLIKRANQFASPVIYSNQKLLTLIEFASVWR